MGWGEAEPSEPSLPWEWRLSDGEVGTGNFLSNQNSAPPPSSSCSLGLDPLLAPLQGLLDSGVCVMTVPERSPACWHQPPLAHWTQPRGLQLLCWGAWPSLCSLPPLTCSHPLLCAVRVPGSGRPSCLAPPCCPGDALPELSTRTFPIWSGLDHILLVPSTLPSWADTLSLWSGLGLSVCPYFSGPSVQPCPPGPCVS